MKNNPVGWRIENLQALADHYGITYSRPKNGSSHLTFRASENIKLTVPAKRPIKPVYIKLFARMIEDITNGSA